MTVRTCENCSASKYKDDDTRWCILNPPVAVCTTSKSYGTAWPVVFNDAVCHQHKTDALDEFFL